MDPAHLESLKNLDRIAGVDPLPPDWYYFPLEEIMGPDDVFGAQSWPGFANDLTRWKLWASESGWLSVLATICRPFEDVDRHHQLARRRIGAGEVRRVRQMAERIGFAGLAPQYELDITDGSTERIAVRFGGQLKCVECDGNHPPGFRALWRRIHRHAPLVGRYSPWWARSWWGNFLDWGQS